MAHLPWRNAGTESDASAAIVDWCSGYYGCVAVWWERRVEDACGADFVFLLGGSCRIGDLCGVVMLCQRCCRYCLDRMIVDDKFGFRF